MIWEKANLLRFGLQTIVQNGSVLMVSFRNTGTFLLEQLIDGTPSKGILPLFLPHLLHSRPVYIYVEGLSPEYAPAEDDKLALVYTGSRYFIQRLIQAKNNATNEYWKWAARNYHGFWTGAYDPSISFVRKSSFAIPLALMTANFL
jgi:hypothetical protein